MHKIFSAIEEGNLENFQKEILDNPSALDLQDDEGWGVLNLCIQYDMQDFTEYALHAMSSLQVNAQAPGHPVLLAMTNGNKNAFNLLMNSQKIDYLHSDKSGENLLFNSLFVQDRDYFYSLAQKGIDAYEPNGAGVSPFSYCIEKNLHELLNVIYQPDLLQEKYDEFFIKKAIQNNNHYAFDILFPYTRLEQDELFNLAVDFGNIYVISKVMETENFIPGHDQIRSMTELMCQKHTNELEKNATSEIIDYLFAIKTPFNQFVNKAGQSAWMLAIENDNVEVFNKLIKTSESVNLVDAENHSPLMYAIDHNKPEFVSLLLKKKANPNHLDRYKNTPLIKAVKKGNREIIQELLKYPTHINEVNQNGETALNIAVKFRKMDIVSDLIWAGGELIKNPAQFVKEENIYHFNLQNEYEKLLTNYDEQTIDNFIALNQLGFDLNQKNTDGDSFIHHFIKNGFLANFKTMLRCSFNPDQRDGNGNTPLMCAMNKNSNAYMEGLLAKFSTIDLSLKNSQSEDIYDICIKHKRGDRMAMLIKYDDEITPSHARNAACFLAQYGHLQESWDKIKQFIKTADSSAHHIKDDFGNTLLMLAVAGDNKKDYDFLLKNQLVGNLKDKNNLKQSVYQLLEMLPPEKKQEYRESLIFFSQINEENIQNKPC